MPTKKSDIQKEAENELVLSYLTMRNLIGFSGILLPLILVLTTKTASGEKLIEPSISDYYYTSNGDVLVVLLSVLGVFLFTYNGYNSIEKGLTTLAALCGIGVAFSPTATTSVRSTTILVANEAVPIVFGIERHFIFAGLFFIALAIISLVYFPKLKDDQQVVTPQKKKRNVIYIICGWVIIACIVLLGVYFVFKPSFLKNVPVVFILEAVAIEAFGLSWITKGQTLWPDCEHYLEKGYHDLKDALK
ncbi:MAG: hypothetical protein ABIP27_20900 [Flavobacterium circumlabens]|uniref:hypothetical protein n=1 Tax=Flavobacterium circumlabens TaxID=2133765 RepID=UPI0032634D17